MRVQLGLAVVLVLCLPATIALAGPLREHDELDRLNRRLAGQVVDYTDNHGADRRIYSAALGKRRSLYVYLPPGFDPNQQYPAIVWMHGFHQDERSFLTEVAENLDGAICKGQLPPVIVVAPDGSIGRGILYHPGSFFINSKAGRYEDYLIQDVWGFLVQNYPIRPEPEAHVLAGASMGGFSAYNIGIKYRQSFKIAAAIFPPLNLRWVDCYGHYRGHFDPNCWGWRTDLRRHEVVGRFFGVIVIRLKWVTDPLFGDLPSAIESISRENPIEMIDTYGLKEGELSMWVGYGGRDEFNTTAQIQSFLYRARERGLTVTEVFLPRGHHNYRTALALFPGLIEWLTPQLRPYSPPLNLPRGPAECPEPAAPASAPATGK